MFPLQINGVEYGLSNFLGTHYQEGVPDSSNSVIEHLKNIRVLQCSSKFYPSLGTHSLMCSKNKLVSPGETFFAKTESGSNSFYGIVYGYNPFTGELVFNVFAIYDMAPSSRWLFCVGIRVDSVNYTNSIANRLTGGTSHQEVAQALRFHNHRDPYILFEDMGHPYYTGTVGNGGLEASGEGAVNFYGGSVNLTIGADSERASLYYGNKGFVTLLSYGRNTLFECGITMPSALSDGTTSYTVFVGMKGEGSGDTSPFFIGGMGFSYTHSANSGNWQGFSANNGTLSTVNGSSGPSANTYYRLRIDVVGSTVTFYVNGVSIGTSSTLPTANVNNLMRPCATLLGGLAVAGARTLNVDYFYLEAQGG